MDGVVGAALMATETRDSRSAVHLQAFALTGINELKTIIFVFVLYYLTVLVYTNIGCPRRFASRIRDYFGGFFTANCKRIFILT